MSARRWISATLIAASFIPSALNARPKLEESSLTGACTPQEHEELKQEMEEACGAQPMRCDASMSCDEVFETLGMIEECVLAHQALADKCFRGGGTAQLSKMCEYKVDQDGCLQLLSDKSCDMQQYCPAEPVASL